MKEQVTPTPVGYHFCHFRYLKILVAGLFLVSGIQVGQAQQSGETTVYHASGKKRVHFVDCVRYKKLSPEDQAKFTQMTYAQAEAKGLPPCSRCPNSSTAGKGAGTPSASSNNQTQPASNAGGTTVYHAAGKKRVHFADCVRYKKLSPEDQAKFTQMTYAQAEAKGLPTCSRCPNSSTAGKGAGTPSTSSNNQAQPASNASGTTVFHAAGKKRVHVEGCRRLPSDRSQYTTMTKAEAEAKGLSLCSRCPGSTTAGRGNPQGSGASGNSGNLPESWVNPTPAEVEKKAFSPNERTPLVAMGEDGRLVYNPYTDMGDRILDWSHCGYKGSEVPIPDIAVVETLEPLSGSTTSNGNMAYPNGPDSLASIQTALDKVAAMEPDAAGFRGAVLLKKGTYYVDGGLQVGSGVVLRGEGAGPDGTVLITSIPGGGGEAINIGGGDGVEFVGEANSVRIADSYVPSGSTQLTLTDASQFKPGDFVCVRKTVNDQWIADLGMGQRLRHIRGGAEGANKKPWKPESYQFRHIRQIKDVSGNTITLEVMLPQSFEEQHGGGEVFIVDVSKLTTQAGVESLRIVSNYDTTVRDTGKDANFLNIKTGIRVTSASDCWVRNCTVLHASFAAVQVAKNTKHVTVRDCKYLEPVGPKRGGNRYSFSVAGGTLHLFYNCYSEDGRHDFAGGSRNMGPYAFVNCTAVRGGQSEPHHRWGTGFLFDSITTKDGVLAAINRGDSGSGHGWSAANTLIWNSDAKNIVVFDPETTGENNFAIGFRGPKQSEYETRGLVYANNRAGYWGTPGEGNYYGFALMGNGYIESPDQPVEPASLFTQQLIDRIGKDKAQQVLNL